MIPPDELISCKVFLKNEGDSDLAMIIESFANSEKYSLLINPDNHEKSIGKNITKGISSDVIIVQYNNIEKSKILDFIDKLRNLFKNRLLNGPSIIVTNRNDIDETIIFIAKSVEEHHEYKIYL